MNTRWMKIAANLITAGVWVALLVKSVRRLSQRPWRTVLNEAKVSASKAAAHCQASPTLLPHPSDGEETALATSSAREAAILHAYDVAPERAQEGERAVILTVGNTQVEKMGDAAAEVAVPLEVSFRAREHVPRTRAMVLRVTLEGGPRSWRVSGHRWD